jgi:ABC-type phosphate/phosphonate transport system substrate-binding protein
LDERIKLTLLDAFLALDASIPEHRKILRSQGANAYLPAASENFEIVRIAADQADLLAEDHEN